LPKDNETMQLPLDGPVIPAEPQGFAPDQMIRCDECLRANPPTRVSCLYCSAALPHDESTAKLRKPVLRQPEKHELGFNCIPLLNQHEKLTGVARAEAAKLLKLSTEELEHLLLAKVSLPIARTANKDEAQLVLERLREWGVAIMTISDEELGVGEQNISRIRGMLIEDDSVTVYQTAGKDAVVIDWSKVSLIVAGRLVTRKVELSERLTRRGENEIIDSSQFFSDEPVFDLYSSDLAQTFRVGANSFDFSCLNEQKSLVAGENLNRLKAHVNAKAVNVTLDTAYTQVKNLLDLVWPSEQETQSRGWRRDSPGKYSVGESLLNSNETQFTRYSRLRHYFSAAGPR